MSLQEQYDDAMFDYSTSQFESAIEKFRSILAEDPSYFEAQLSLGMAHYRLGDFAKAIEEGHNAEKMRPNEQLVHTNLSLFYMKSGDKTAAEHHGLQARIASWKTPAAAEAPASTEGELQMAKPPPPAPVKLPEMPWKKNKASNITPKKTDG
jgi:Flp pilus assembly protein TadD